MTDASENNGTTEIKRGDLVTCVLAGGGRATLRALGPPEMGRNMLVVWVCDEDEWNDGDNGEGVPWPAKHVVEAHTND